MTDDLDLRAIHRRHEPDPAFVAELGHRLEAITATSGPVASNVPRSAVTELELAGLRRSPARRRGGRALRAALAIAGAAACVALFAVVTARDDGAPNDDPSPPTIAPERNGWVAFARLEEGGDIDVFVVREGEAPKRIAGSATDTSVQMCPAFSPDGRRILFGQATFVRGEAGYQDPELVISDVAADGSLLGSTTIPLDSVGVPPCGIWSPDGEWVAFGDGTDAILLLDTLTDEVRRLTGHAASDLEWRPGTDELAIADGQIEIYSITSGEVRTIGGAGVRHLTWSPDGTTIAFSRPNAISDDRASLWLVDADGTNERQLAPEDVMIHGVGPVWSPDGRYVAYQRVCDRAPEVTMCREQHEVVLVSVVDDAGSPSGTQVVIPPPATIRDGRQVWWYPFSVTWSPDGTMLLYLAWDSDLASSRSGLIAMPIDTARAPVVLVDQIDVAAYGGFPWLTVQTWGRQPDGSPR